MIPPVRVCYGWGVTRQLGDGMRSLRDFCYGSYCKVGNWNPSALGVCLCVFVVLIIWSSCRLTRVFSLLSLVPGVSVNRSKDVDMHALSWKGTHLFLSRSLSLTHTHTQVKGVFHYVTRAVVVMSGAEELSSVWEPTASRCGRQFFVNSWKLFLLLWLRGFWSLCKEIPQPKSPAVGECVSNAQLWAMGELG